MSGPSSGAVFLSYASQDAGAAQRICEALQAAGIEVWFDQTGLGGGDAWDAEIRGRIRECALFVPVISANTESRLEGYFRLEWRLAEQRTHQMARGKPFLVPVVIDDTRDDKAHVPDCFVDVQWTRLANGEGAESFARRIKGLLMQTDAAPVAHGSGHADAPVPAISLRDMESLQRRRRPIAWPWMAIPAALAVGVAAFWVLSGRRTDSVQPVAASSAAGKGAATDVAPTSASRTSVAVMPFANLTGDTSKDYLGDGMAEELINKLSGVQGLRIPARTSTFSYKGRNVDARQIARDLNVGTILEGSVRSAGATIRITAQLVDAQTDSHLWSETYDRKLTDLFKLQDELAAAIVKALQVNLHGASPVATVAQAPPTQDLEAYQLYVQANSLLDRPLAQNYQRAVELASQAVARDPTFTRAFAVLGIAELGLYQNGWPREHLVAAEKHALKALSLGPDAIAQVALAQIDTMRGRWLEVESRDQAAASLASADATTFSFRATHLSGAGKLQAAREAAQRAYDLAPANARAAAAMAAILTSQGRADEANRLAEVAVALGLPHYFSWLITSTSLAARESGQFDKAAELEVNASGEWLRRETDQQALAQIIRSVYAALADPAQRNAALAAQGRWYATLQSAQTNTAIRVRMCMQGVQRYVLLKAVDQAYALALRCPDMDNGTSVGSITSNMTTALWSPDMRPFRRDQRFQAFIARSGLMDYWNKYGPPDECDLSNGRLTCH